MTLVVTSSRKKGMSAEQINPQQLCAK